jgi:hypothetical protein
MKTIIAGSRTASLQDVIKALELCPFTEKITEVVSGGARGPDSYGEILAEEYMTPIKRFPAQWNTYGTRAGYIRNGEMAEYADALIAIWNGHSNGTRDMIQRAKEKNLEVYVHLINNKSHT